jgi:subtilisin family serine protease
MATSKKRSKTAATAKPAAKKSSAKASASGRASGKASGKQPADFPDRIYAVASPHSLGGVSMFTPGLTIDASNVQAFESDEPLVRRAIARLQEAGFEVLQASTRSINIAGSRATFERAFSTHLVSVERESIRSGGKVAMTSCIDVPDTPLFGLVDTASSGFADVLEGVAIEQPYALQTPTAFPPPARYWHLDVPADVSLGCNADRAHRSGVTGSGIRIAMVDTGQAVHPFFTERGYRVMPTVLGPGTVDAHIDSVGHGTGESANIFATAPDITLLPVKCANASGSLVNTTAAFAAAAALNPTVISCSWSRNIQNGPLDAAANALAAEIAAAVNAGIIVCFSASNGGWGFPAQMPEVIAVGGVFMNRDGSMRASDYASGFMSNIFPGRRVPDVSGLVGMRPKAAYIMLPLSEGAQIDVGNAGGVHPNGDETANNDGWAAFSGTSASCPQVAGVCALIKQACPRLTPAEVKDILMRTARDVTVGSSSPLTGLPAGSPAGVGPDNATGAGMVDAHRAVLLAKLRCTVVPFLPPVFPPVVPFLPPRLPITPLIPFLPPRLPVTPLIPFLPPRVPITPLIPFLPPRLPVVPLIPFMPPRLPFGPGPGPGIPGPGPGPGLMPQDQGMPMTPDDVAAIEQMLLDSKDPLI